nr:hypothetical protein [Tanacetum cinerariifolium]
MDEALVPYARRLRIGRSNFLLLSNISSKESTLQLVYDVLPLTPFFKIFLVTADVLEIYMQEFWATTTVHHYFIRFKMDNKKHIVNLESFREMLHICPRLPDVPEIYMQKFWATATVHHYSIRFMMENKKHIVNLESFREQFYICPRLPGQPFVKPPFEEEILAFLWFLGHNGVIRRLTDVQPWRSFAAIINKCLTGKGQAMIAYGYLRLKFFKGYTTRGM